MSRFRDRGFGAGTGPDAARRLVLLGPSISFVTHRPGAEYIFALAPIPSVLLRFFVHRGADLGLKGPVVRAPSS